MPNAPTHDAITLITAVGANIAYFQLAPHPDLTLAALFTASYVFAGYACAGDLDLDSERVPKMGASALSLVALPTMCAASLLVVAWFGDGGVIRVGYLAAVCTLMFWLSLWGISRLGPHIDANQVTEAGWFSIFSFVRLHPQWTSALLAGFILAGSAHSLADAISTWFKRRF